MGAEERCAAHFAEAHPADTARRLETVAVREAVAFLDGLSAEVAAQVLEASTAWAGARCLDAMRSERAAELVEHLAPDATLRLVRPLRKETRHRIIAACSAVVRGRLEHQLRYAPGTAGAAMDPVVLSLPEDMTVVNAARELRRAPHGVYYYIYVVNRENRLVGVLDVRELMMARSKERLISVMKRDVIGVSPQSELAAVEAHPAWRDVDALPVMGRDGEILGLVRHRTLRRKADPIRREIRVDELGATLVRLGEVYWSTFALLLQSAAVAVTRPTPPSATRRSP